jgi:dephospho-CoA kinase
MIDSRNHPSTTARTLLISALTGGIATGKSVVANVLKELGCYIHEADKAAHKLTAPNTLAWKKIVSRYGQEILSNNKHINRHKLGKLVFSDKKELNFLNELVHPYVLQDLLKTIKEIQQKNKYQIFISEAAIVIESGFAKYFEKIIVVYCDPDIQLQRLMKRDRIIRPEALDRINSQMPAQEKLKHADYTIDTSGTLKETIEQSERLYRNLLSDYLLKQQQKAEDKKPEDRRVKIKTRTGNNLMSKHR